MDIVRNLRLGQWAIRKLALTVSRDDLVLDVGSGNNPHPRADVLLEKFVSGQHRHGTAVVADRPVVFADACRMPFREGAFDFIIAMHVLEHMRNPAEFLAELMRVGKAGYIETPNVVFERLVPYDVHLLEIMEVGGKLFIQKKSAPATDPFLAALDLPKHRPDWSRLFYANPRYFHVCHHWRGKIAFEIANPEEQCDWYQDDVPADVPTPVDGYAMGGWRRVPLSLLRRWHARRQRRSVDLLNLLVCPVCRSELARRPTTLRCPRCASEYSFYPHPQFNVPPQT